MYKIKEMFDKLPKDKQKEIFCDTVAMLNEHQINFIELKMLRDVTDGHLNEEISEDWVANMHPNGKHWSLEETSDVLQSYGLQYNKYDWFAILNMMYSDYFGAVPNDTESYVKLARKWFEDEDIDDPIHKTFDYYFHIVK